MYVVKKGAFNMHTAVLFTQIKPGCLYKFEQNHKVLVYHAHVAF